jgi:hypothetical protein
MIKNAEFFVAEICAEKAILAAFTFRAVTAVDALFAFLAIVAVIAFFEADAFVAKFAIVDIVAVDAVEVEE